MANEGSRPPFYLAGWRLLFDVSFFVIVSTIGLNIVFGIIVETFDELRQERVRKFDQSFFMTLIWIVALLYTEQGRRKSES